MDIRESIEVSYEKAEVPQLGLRLESSSRQRLEIALLVALTLHVLIFLTLVRLGRLAPTADVTAELHPRPTPVRVVFYETQPKPRETPPPETDVVSDRLSRARSEVTPLTPAPTRLPAAAGRSPEERKPAEGRSPAPRQAPAPPSPPRPGAQAREGDAAAEPPDDLPIRERITPTATLRSPSLRAGEPGAGPESPIFAGAALAAAVRRGLGEGFGNVQSGVGETGALEFDAKDFEWGPYARKVYEIVDRNWKSVIPLSARTPGVQGKVKLRFRILKNGGIESLELLESANRASLDQAALASIELSNPLPPLPPEYPRSAVGVTFGYYYNLPVDRGE